MYGILQFCRDANVLSRKVLSTQDGARIQAEPFFFHCIQLCNMGVNDHHIPVTCPANNSGKGFFWATQRCPSTFWFSFVSSKRRLPSLHIGLRFSTEKYWQGLDYRQCVLLVKTLTGNTDVLVFSRLFEESGDFLKSHRLSTLPEKKGTNGVHARIGKT